MVKLIKIPRNIFQTWSTKNISNDLKKITETWSTKNPNYAYFLYDDNECDGFIKKHFSTNIHTAYRRLIPGAFKADLWRYCVLYIYGGVYVDIDTICFENIDLFLNEDIEFMTPNDLNNNIKIGTHNLFNAFIASIPKHPILLECINRVVFNIENNILPYSNLDFAGPGILGRSTNNYLKLNETTSFIGKEGIHQNTVSILYFDFNTEYVRNGENIILFQNKNGNSQIKLIYDEEIKNSQHVDWGTCKNPIRPLPLNDATTYNNPTIVTMIYNIREKENNLSGTSLNHKMDYYFNLAKNFILKLDYPLIVFTDNKEYIDIINNERDPFKEKTYVFYQPLEETYFYKDMEQLHELQKKFTIRNGNLEHETPLYIILNNNKHCFMEKAIHLNPFNGKHFIWMDFGINHVAKNPERIHDWIHMVPDKIKQLCINPYTENTNPKHHFECIYHNMAGGLFSGSSQNLLKYCELFKQKTEQIYSEEWYQIDEAVMTIVQKENPEMFDLFYGDYSGIISNYLDPIHDIGLILRGIQKYIDANKTREAYNILFYCGKYFETHIEDGNAFFYIHQHLIVDYYNNDKLIVEGVVTLINLLKIYNPNDILRLIEINKSNISFYKNNHLIL
jgi:hypothetical protein